MQPATGRGSPRLSASTSYWQASEQELVEPQRNTLKDKRINKRPGQDALIRPLLSENPVPALISVCRENGALPYQWSRHQRRTIRVTIEPARSPDPEGSRRPSGLGARLSRPGARADSLTTCAPSSRRRTTCRQLPAGLAPWCQFGDRADAGRHTPGDAAGSFFDCARGTQRLPGRGQFGPTPRLPWSHRPPPPRLPTASPKGCRQPAVGLPPPRPWCSTQHTGQMPLNTSGHFHRGFLDAHGAPKGSPRAAARRPASVPGVPEWHPGWTAHIHGHRSVVRQVPHGIGRDTPASPPSPEGSALPPLPRSRSARRPAGHRAGCRALVPAGRSPLPEGSDRPSVGTRTRHLHRCLGRSPVPGCGADLDHQCPGSRSCLGGVIDSDSQRSLPQGLLSRDDAKRTAEAACSAPSRRACTLARSTG